jgi:putative ABC transport system ATP-binding protein
MLTDSTDNMLASGADMRATKASMLRDSSERTIRIRGLNQFFGTGELRKQVLFGNNLDVYQGQIVIMTGPSGSGKTTLLTLIGTLRTVQEGSLQVLGRQLRGAPQADLVAARRDIGFIFQAHNLFGSLTAMQNVRMAMELFNFPEDEMRERATKLLTRLGLGHRLHYKPGSLSGGQKQRVAIARALAHGPKIVLADEPTAALDEQSGREVVTLLKELADEQGVTILLVTHDNRILDVADRIVNMVDGRIKSDVVVKEADLIVEFVQKAAPFRGLTLNTLASIADKMWAEQVLEGETIIRQGDPGENFYLVRQGELEILKTDGDHERVVATITDGDCFGEEALLTGNPRNATVRAKKDSLLYVLGEEDFKTAVAASDSLRDQLRKVLFERQ